MRIVDDVLAIARGGVASYGDIGPDDRRSPAAGRTGDEPAR
ncbi:hypothetical protein [Nocardia cyriacigeorgica]|nr:hypothetical protein [Nocardia cyriacigeorgica]